MVYSSNMPSLLLLLLFIKLSFIIFSFDSSAAKTCRKTNSCYGGSLVVRFPFQLLTDHDNRDGEQPSCGYPGFDIWCNHTESESESAEMMISLPSGVFTVKGIFYEYQMLTIDDPSKCLPKRLLEQNLSLSGTPFRIANLGSYTLLNCSSSARLEREGQVFERIPCLSGEGYTVVARPTVLFKSTPSLCAVVATVMVPVVSSERWWIDHSWESYLSSYVGIAWDNPRCGSCEMQGGYCGFSGKEPLEIACFNLPKHGIPKGSQYVLYLITALAILGFLFFNCPLKRCLLRSASNQLTNQSTVTDRNVESLGLNEAVIETFAGDCSSSSKRLLSSSYSACPICLSEYRTKDTLRTLPHCFHYFHSHCIDEWLRINSTCPLCRHSPFISPRTTTI